MWRGHWKRINGFKNDTWTDNMARSVSFQNVGYCWGHNLADVTVWKNLFDNTGSAYSNQDLWEIFDSTEMTYMPYVYDNFGTSFYAHVFACTRVHSRALIQQPTCIYK